MSRYRTEAARSVILISTLATAVACGDSSSGAGGAGGNGTVTSGGSTASVTSTNTTVAQSTTAAPASGQTSSSSGPLTCDMPYTNVPEGGECNLLAQDCGAGKTCTIQVDAQGTTATTVCVSANGFKPRGAACSTPSECQAGLICIGKCTPICCPSNDQPCQGGECNINVTFDESTFTAMVCAYNDACQLFTPMACPMGEVCHPADGLASCSTPSPNPVAEGEVCEFLNDCGDMQACVGQSGEYRCRYACMMGSMAAPGMGGCPGGQACQPVDFGLPDIGACFPM